MASHQSINLSNETKSMMLGLVGVAMFSPTLPLSRVVVEFFSPTFITLIRMCVAGLCALLILLVSRQSLPTFRQLGALLLVGLCVGIGFPYFAALAMQGMTSANGSIILGALPLATAVCATLVVGERPSFKFWLLAVLGLILVLSFAGLRGGIAGFSNVALFAAVFSAAMGFAIGGRLSSQMAGWQVICWALAICLPLVLWPTFETFQYVDFSVSVPVSAWLSLLYLCLFSQLIGFFFWYRGLALGGIARVGQIQLLQPFFTLLVAWLVLNESIDSVMIVFAIATCIVVWLSKNAQIQRMPHRN